MSQVRGHQTDEGHTASKIRDRKQTPVIPSVLPKSPGKRPPFRYEKTTHRDTQTADQASGSLGGLCENTDAGPTPDVPDSVGPEWDPIIYIPHKLSHGAAVAAPGALL